MINATTLSLQKDTISAEYARWFQHNYNIPIPANKCSIQNKHILLNKSNLPLGQRSVFLQGQYPNKIWSIPWKAAPCPLKECSVHFQMSNPPFKGAVPLLEKSIFLHDICSIIDIGHRFQKRNGWNCEHYHMFKQCLIVLRFNDAHSSNYNIFQEGSCLHQRVLFPEYGSLSWKNITLCIQKNDVQ